MDENTIEFKLKQKLEAGDITQEEYDKLYQKFTDLDLLNSTVKSKPKKAIKKWSFSGSTNTSGAEVDGPVLSSGKLNVDGDLKCQRLSISGSIHVDGDLTVIGKTSTNGRVTINGSAKFGESVSVNGAITILGDVYATEAITISGKSNVDGDINSSGPLKASGKLSCENVRSSSFVRLSGKFNVKEDLIARSIEISNGLFRVGGDLKAETVTIFPKYQTYGKKQNIDNIKTDEIEGIPDIGQFVTNLVYSIVPNMLSGITNIFGDKTLDRFDIAGNLEGNYIDISQTHVYGNIIGDEIILGPGVVVDGSVKYRKWVETDEGNEIKSEKID